jgi:four helix bundle protein
MLGLKSLNVYQRAYKMAIKIRKITQEFPPAERYQIVNQLWRWALSIPLNIAEGYGRKDSHNEFQHFLRNSLGSCNEVRVLLEISKDLGYITSKDYHKLESEYEIISKQLYKLRQRQKPDN